MKDILFIIFLTVSSLQVSSQSICTPILDDISSIQNNYRESPILSLSNLIDGDSFSFFDGDGLTNLFDLGYIKGIWAGGVDSSGNLKVAASGYGVRGYDFIPGPIWRDFQGEVELCDFFKRIWVLEGSEILRLQDRFENGVLNVDNIPTDILEWPARGNPHLSILIEEDLAPFFDFDQDGLYDPLRGDYPIALSEAPTFIPSQFRFYVYNDMTVHRESGGDPLEIEFQVIEWVVNCANSNDSETSIFTRLNYINRGDEELRDFRIGLWEDGDLGCFTNDYVGCRPSLDATFAYNAEGIDPDTCSFGINNFSFPFNLGILLTNRHL